MSCVWYLQSFLHACRILHLAASGVLERWTQFYLQSENNCGKSVNLQETNPFTLENIQGLFLVLFALLFLSLFVFLLEYTPTAKVKELFDKVKVRIQKRLCLALSL